jgi:hypothetical protein
MLCASRVEHRSCGSLGHDIVEIAAEPRTGQGRNPFRRLANAVADTFTALRSGLSDWRRCQSPLRTPFPMSRLGSVSCTLQRGKILPQACCSGADML